MITGTSGQLGHDTVAAARAANHEVIALSHADLDIKRARDVRRTIANERPDAIINCAGYTNVDAAEDDRELAFAINAEGAANIAIASHRYDAKVIYISSDYVFDGKKESPYLESDEANPLSVYGQSKLAGELETSNNNPRHFVVRTSWLFGVTGQNFVNTMLYLARENDEVLVVADQVGCPTYTGHLAAALVQLLDSTQYGVHHIAGWGECSWLEYAREIFRQAGAGCRVMAATTDMVARKAPRPPYSSLMSEREYPICLPRWQKGLAEFLNLRSELVSAVVATQESA